MARTVTQRRAAVPAALVLATVLFVTVLFVTVLVAALVSVGPASAQDETDSVQNDTDSVQNDTDSVQNDTDSVQNDTDSAGELRLLRQTVFVAAEGELNLALEWTGPVTQDLFLSVVFHQPIVDPAAVGETPSTVLNRTAPVALASLPRLSPQTFEATVGFRSTGPVDPARIFLPDSGTYPMTVEIRSPDGAVAAVRSHLIRLPSETAEIPLLPVAVIVPVAASASVDDGLGVAEILELLNAYPNLLLTLQIDDGVLNQLESDPDLAATFAAAVRDRPVLARPSFNLDPSALAEIGRPELFALANDHASQRLAALGLSPSTSTIALEASLTQAGAELVLSLGFSQVAIVGPASASDAGVISTPVGRLQLIEPDEDLTQLLTASNRSVERAYDLMATLATRYNSDRRAVIIGGDRFGALDPTGLRIVLDALNQPALLQPDGLIEAARGTPGLPVRPAEQAQQNLNGVAGQLADISRLAQTAAEFTGDGAFNEQDLSILSSLSRDRNPEDRLRAVDRVLADLEDTFDVISLPGTRSVTLAAQRNPLPLTIENTSDGPRQVALVFQSDRVAVLESASESAAPTERMVVSVPPGIHTVDLTVQAQTLGVSTLQITAVTPDGEQILGATEFRLRSTAVPGLGWLLFGVALLFLLIWWIRQWRSAATEPAREDMDGDSSSGQTAGAQPAPADVRQPKKAPAAARAAEGRLQ